jgi:carboxyl-terminal processing protease
MVAVTLMVGIAAGIVLDRFVIARYSALGVVPEDAVAEFSLIAQAWNTIQEQYVDRPAVQPDVLTYGAIRGMVDALGDTGHSRFMAPDTVERHRAAIRGRYEGIGAYVQMEDGQVVIVSPMEGSPAQKAGLEPGDVILRVNGESIADLGLDEVINRITGPVGSEVRLTLLRPETGETYTVSVTRESFRVRNVTWAMIPETGIAHVRIARFSDGVAEDLTEALEAIDERDVDALILDLRSNPGGLLSEAVDTASLFLEEGTILLTRDAEGEITTIVDEPVVLAPTIPMVVLINEGTASAAEIVTAALQEAERATVMGQRTFGTGTVLRQFPLDDGSVLLLAVEEWLTPEGEVIWHRGIPPDIEVPLPAGVSPLYPVGMRRVDELEAIEDVQLLRAIEFLSTVEPVETV